MTVSRRWIALVSTALMLLVGATGCKTGSKRFSCNQTSCATTACGKSACAVGCDSKVSCGSCQIGKLARCSKFRCKTPCDCKTSCADTACVIKPRTGCQTSCAAVQLGRPIYGPPNKPNKPKAKAKAKAKAKPVEAPKKALREKPTASPMPRKASPAPKPQPKKEATTRNPFALPIAPAPAPNDTAENENPFLRVSQTQEVSTPATVAVGLRHVEDANPQIELAPPAAPGPSTYSKAWADALGLPTNDAPQVERYRRN